MSSCTRGLPASGFVGLLTLALLLSAGGRATADAQPRVPDTGMAALGGEVGFWLPTEDLLEAGPTIAGLFEYYLTPRVGLRTTFGWAQNDFEFEEDDGLRTNRLTFSLLYNWEHGKWHPFVGAGAGAYFLQRRDNGSDIGDSETEPGFHVGGGIEYFTARTVSIKGEGLYHIVSDDPVLETSGLTLTIGLKKYF